MKILAVGDIVGRTGIHKLKECLPNLIQKEKIDFCVVNRRKCSRWNGNYGENVSRYVKAKCGCCDNGKSYMG